MGSAIATRKRRLDHRAAKRQAESRQGLPRNDQLIRALSALRELLRVDGADLYELADRYGVTTRTIRRDLAALEAVGLPLVQTNDGRRKRWRVAFEDDLGQLSKLFEVSHYLALKVALAQRPALGKTSLTFAALEDLSDKLETALGPSGREQLRAIEACFHSYEKFAYRRSAPDVLWPLVRAIAEHRVCRVTYRAPRANPKPTSFDVLPLRLFVHSGAVYLMCHMVKHRGLGTLNLQRLQNLVVTKKQMQPPPGFDPSALEDSAFGVHAGGEPTTYVLRFEADVAEFIRERVWHSSQKLRELAGGRVELRFRCGATYEVSSWVASWGEGVEVLRPTFMRRELQELGKWLVSTYTRRRPAIRTRRTASE